MGWSLGLICALVAVGQCAGTCRTPASKWTLQAKDSTPVNGQPGGQGDGLGTVRGQLPDPGAAQSAVAQRGRSTVRLGWTVEDPQDDARAIDAAPGLGCGIVRGLLGRLRDRPRRLDCASGLSTRRGLLGRIGTVLRDRPRALSFPAGQSGRFLSGCGTVRGGLGLLARWISRPGRVETLGPSHRPLLERWAGRTWTRGRFYSRRPR